MNTTEVRQKMKASKKANELISSALWVASCGLGNGARYNAARQNLEDYIAELELENKKLFIHNSAMFKKLMSLDSPNDTQKETFVYGKEREE